MTSKTTTVDIDLDEDAVASTGTANTIVDEDAGIPVHQRTGGDVVDEDSDPADKLPDHAVRNDDGSITLPLLFPRKISSRKDGKVREKDYAELRFHRLTGADQRAIAAAGDEAQIAVTIGRSTRINQAVMNALYDKMDLADITAAGKVINHFLSSGPKTGR